MKNSFKGESSTLLTIVHLLTGSHYFRSYNVSKFPEILIRFSIEFLTINYVMNIFTSGRILLTIGDGTLKI